LLLPAGTILISKMAEEQQPQSNSPEMPKPSGAARRRGRRGGRGRRRPAPAAPISDQPTETELPAKQIEPPIRLGETPVRPVPSRQKFQPPVHAPRAAKPGGSPLLQAADDVADVIESLKQTLAQMEEVMELIELAERQKLTDEREIESLHRALRQLQSRRPD
jgi:hypothetical protein